MIELKEINPRLYQERIFSTSAKSNTLVVIPTGMGKTMIAMMLAVHRLNKKPNSKVLFMAPTKPLCAQHMKTFEKHLSVSKDLMCLLTGEIPPKKRRDLWETAFFVFATPQTIANDLVSGNFEFDDFSLVVVDEAHRAVGDYDYVFLAKQYFKLASNPHLLALTASPGSDKEKINEICSNLHITAVEIRNEESEDVVEYVKKKEIENVFIPLPEALKEVKEMFERVLSRKLNILKENKVIRYADINKVGKGFLLQLQGKFASQSAGNWYLMKNISVIASCVKIMHCLELLQTQGVNSLAIFLEGLKKQKSKAAISLVTDIEFREGMQRVFELKSKHYEHPKFEALLKIVENQLQNKSDSKMIIFANFRATVEKIVKMLQSLENCHPIPLIGQAGERGLKQKDQINVLKNFDSDLNNILVCTSIGEEGLSISSLDIAIFYENVPSGIRTIQRSGRVGRCKVGKIIRLITKDTIDERYYWVAHNKKKKMEELLDDMQQKLLNDY